MLSPCGRSSAHYRRYEDSDLERLQKILYYRKLGLSLDEIKAILDDPTTDPLEHLRRPHDLLIKQSERLAEMYIADPRPASPPTASGGPRVWHSTCTMPCTPTPTMPRTAERDRLGRCMDQQAVTIRRGDRLPLMLSPWFDERIHYDNDHIVGVVPKTLKLMLD